MLALAYGLLPWYLPTKWLARHLSANLSRDLGRPARIERISLSWRHGIRMEGITVDDLTGPGRPATLLRIATARCGLTPIRTLFREKVDRLELEQANVWLSLLPDGRLNIDDLGDRRQRVGLPTFRYVLRDAVLHLDLPDLPAQCRMDSLQCTLDTAKGILRFDGDATIRPHRPPGGDGDASSGRFLIDAEIQVPRLKSGINLAGGGELRWEKVDLKEIPFRRMPRFGLDAVYGQCDGRVRIRTQLDLGIDYEVNVRLEGVQARRTGRSRPDHIEDGVFAANGHWDPTTDFLVVNRLDYRMPALRIRDSGSADRPAVILDPLTTEPVRLDLVGDVERLDHLRREFSAVDAALSRFDIQAEHGGRFTLQLAHGPSSTRLRVTADATAVALRGGDYLRAGAGTTKKIALDVSRTEDGRMQLRQARLDLDDLHWEAEASLPLPPPEAVLAWPTVAAAMKSTTARLRFSTEHVEQLAAHLPTADALLGAGPRRGPVKMEAAIDAGADAIAFRLHAESPVGAEWRVRDVFHKPAQSPLSADLTWEAEARQPERMRRITGKILLGEDGIVVRPSEATLGFQRQANSADDHPLRLRDARLQTRLAVSVVGMDRLLPHLPRLRESLCAAGARLDVEGDDVQLAGNADTAVEAETGYEAEAFTWRTSVTANLAMTDIRIGELFQKAAGEPAVVAVTLAGRRTNGVHAVPESSARIALPGINVRTGCRSSDRDAARDVQLAVDITDARRALANSPMWARRLAPCDFAGQATAEVRVSHSAQSNALAIAADAGGLQFTIPVEPAFAKADGLACRLSFEARMSSGQLVSGTLAPGEARLAGCRARWSGGRFTLSPSGSAWYRDILSCPGALPPGLLTRPVGRLLESAELEGHFEAEADAALRSMSATINRWTDRLGLVGRVAGDARLRMGPDSDRLAGTINVTKAHLALDLPENTPFMKPIGMDSSVVFDIEQTHGTKPGDASAGPVVLLHKAALSARENLVELQGRFDRPRTAAPASQPAARLAVSAAVRRLDQLQSMFPSLMRPPARGEILAQGTLTMEGNRWHVESSRITLQDVVLTVEDTPVRVRGRIETAGDTILVEPATIGGGGSQMTVSGRFTTGAAPTARVGIHAPRLDVDEIRRLADSLRPARTPDSRPSRAHAAGWDLLRRADMDLYVSIDRMQITNPHIDVRTDVQAASVGVTARDGVIDVPIHMATDGGVVPMRIRFLLNEPEPYFDLTYSAESIAPGRSVEAYLHRWFPGFRASGPVTLIDRTLQRLSPPPGEPNHPVGSGELIIEGGYVEGKAAPDWLVTIFPGLNLARYDFVRMHDWFTKHPDGRVDHRMIFQGKYYHLYMEGHTDADRNCRYEVGIDLLARLESKYWVDTQQGRIPLFVKTGRLRGDGTLDPDVVTFTPMGRVVETLAVQNNPAITAYYAIRKQMLNLMEKRRGIP